jgi:glycosyltransferase involved in cell wall biosynthesis
LAISGMGYIYAYDSTQHLKKQLLSVLYELFLKFIIKHKNKNIIVQNHDDYNRFLEYKNVNENELKLIRGSGVDLSLYQDLDMSLKEKIVLFPARVLIDKGAVEFYEAATLLKERFSQWRFVMAGVLDYSNPTMIKKSLLETWKKSGNIELVGHIDSIHSLYAKASIVCLPSYGEGLPKSILEASAAGCAVVTTDVVGCRDAIINGVTGILVKVKDTEALVDALLKLIENSNLRRSYGIAGSLYAKNNFGISEVIDSTLALYEDKK